ncbi:extracellular calcium-sensing receptor-like [Latimeria chalumnae]|uniref:extracellular calcium-sensing receptor-like n=1 Tax=Latimeria chalumnae TaxID=7897 RepID=UPI00313C6B79
MTAHFYVGIGPGADWLHSKRKKLNNNITQRFTAYCELCEIQNGCPSELGNTSSIEVTIDILDPDTYILKNFRFLAYQWLYSMIFAINEINESENLLPNITLGFKIYDSCNLEQRATKGTMWMVTGKEEIVPNYDCQTHSPLAAVIGDSFSSISTQIARVLGLYHYPQISYFSTLGKLSDKNEFPSFFRTIPSDEFQSLGIAWLVKHFGWTWVGFIAEDRDYGQQGIQVVKEEILKAGGCVAFTESFPTVYSRKVIEDIVEVIKKSLANAVVLFASDFSLTPLVEEISRQNITGKMWISSEAWTTSTLFTKKHHLRTLFGTTGLTIQEIEIPEFKEYLFNLHPTKFPNDIFIKGFWEKIFDCKWPKLNSNFTTNNDLNTATKVCTGEEKLNETDHAFKDVSTFTYNVYTAVYAAAHALHDMYACKPGEGPFDNKTCANIQDFEPWQLLYYVKHVNFTTSDGMKVFFDKNGNPPPVYDIINWQAAPDNKLKHVKVGSLDFSAFKGQELIINESAITWNGGHTQVPHSVCSESCTPGYRKAVRAGEPVCCFDCVPCSSGEISNQTDAAECMKCPDGYWPNEKQDECIPKIIEFLSYEEPMGAILVATSISWAIISTTVLCIFIKYRDTPIVKANNRDLSYLLLIALALCFLSSLIFIGQPNTVTCMLRQTIFGIIFALCVSCVLAKTILVVIAFNATKPNSNLKKWVGNKLPNSIVFICTAIQVIICIAWLTTSSPFPEENTKSKKGVIILECNEGSTTAFWCVLGYMGLLAIVSFIVAFLARNLPDSFNEAQFITFSMVVFVSVWLAFIPAYLSTRGKYMVAVEIFALLASSAGLLGCIFFPKCYIIILRPEVNTREYLIGKGKSRKKKM